MQNALQRFVFKEDYTTQYVLWGWNFIVQDKLKLELKLILGRYLGKSSKIDRSVKCAVCNIKYTIGYKVVWNVQSNVDLIRFRTSGPTPVCFS